MLDITSKISCMGIQPSFANCFVDNTVTNIC